MNNITTIDKQNLQSKIYTIRGQQVMLDRDISELYEVETRRLNEQLKRNLENWKSQFAITNDKKGLKIMKAFNYANIQKTKQLKL